MNTILTARHYTVITNNTIGRVDRIVVYVVIGNVAVVVVGVV